MVSIISKSYHIISYHIISYHIISYHIISYHIISIVSGIVSSVRPVLLVVALFSVAIKKKGMHGVFF